MRDLGSGSLRKLPPDVSLVFLRTTWRRRIDRAALDRRTFEFCVLAELRDRLRAGDMWVEGRPKLLRLQLGPRVFQCCQAEVRMTSQKLPR